MANATWSPRRLSKRWSKQQNPLRWIIHSHTHQYMFHSVYVGWTIGKTFRPIKSILQLIVDLFSHRPDHWSPPDVALPRCSSLSVSHVWRQRIRRHQRHYPALPAQQQQNDPFPQFFLHNAHTMPMVFVPASAEQKCAFGLVTCRLDSYAMLVGFNFRLK